MMSQQEVVDIMNPQSELANALPPELIDTIVENNADDKESLLASSCISKSWRAASLRHLFSTATFSYDNDFIRWCDIGSHLPQVPLYVREVAFKPGVMSVPVDQAAAWPSPVEEIEQFVFHVSQISPNPPDIQLPDMPRAHKLVWKTLHVLLPTSCTLETRQFISKFCFLKEVEFTGRFSTVSDAKEFFGLLPPIEVLTIKGMHIHEAGPSSGQSPVFTGDMTNLRRLSLEECLISMDWLVDDILAVSSPTNLQFMRCEDLPPFSRKAFAHLFTLSSESLQELILQPPCSGETFSYGEKTPHFTNQTFPSLMSLSFFIIPLGLPSQSMFPMNWCRKVIEVFPPAPKMTSLTIHFYAARSEEADEIAADQSFDWKQLSERTSKLFPELTRFIIRVTMETDFGARRKASSEALLKKRLEHFGNKLVIEWVDSFESEGE
ncbi:hypothetical protein EDD18DRAFT_61553 [Armillaria luteobubalina]|uniref:F-box domain-containing protein n=1 Tax=Armillaria luteobubalina TaxID=153913 RepID=A0AA39QAR7_9AGAR|nr:hypothetical protein EDD18DRAFT_61553 [Armillaria luteobubalina]